MGNRPGRAQHFACCECWHAGNRQPQNVQVEHSFFSKHSSVTSGFVLNRVKTGFASAVRASLNRGTVQSRFGHCPP